MRVGVIGGMLSLSLVLAIGCGDTNEAQDMSGGGGGAGDMRGGGGGGNDDGGMQPQPGSVNVLHIDPDAPALDVYLNDQVLVRALGYRAASGNMARAAGRAMISVRPAGAAADAQPLLRRQLEFEGNERVLLVLSGTDPSRGQHQLRLDQYPYGAGDGQGVQVRLLHGSPDLYPIDVAIGGQSVIPSVFTRVSDYSQVAGDLAASSQIAVRFAGSSIDLLRATAPGTAVPRGSVLTLVLLGKASPLAADDRFVSLSWLDEASGKLVNLDTQINEQAPRASFFLLNAIRGDAGVTLSLDESAVVSGVGYRAASTVQLVQPGVHPLRLQLGGMNGARVERNAKVLPLLQWLFVATGVPGAAMPDQGPNLFAYLQNRARSGTSLLRFVHAVPDAPAVDWVSGENVPVVSGLRYGEGRGFIEVQDKIPWSTLNLRATGQVTNLATVTFPPALVNASSGEAVTIVLLGTAGADPMAPLSALGVLEPFGPMVGNPIVVDLPITGR